MPFENVDSATRSKPGMEASTIEDKDRCEQETSSSVELGDSELGLQAKESREDDAASAGESAIARKTNEGLKKPTAQTTTNPPAVPRSADWWAIRNAIIVVMLDTTSRTMTRAPDGIMAVLGEGWAGSLTRVLAVYVALPLMRGYAIDVVTDRDW